jgi:recombinational DNA repair protein RecR
VNVTNPTDQGSAVTPAGGGRFVGMRRRVVRTVMGKVFCDECGNPFSEDRCPYCRQRRRGRAGLEGVVETYGGDRLWVSMERADDQDGQWFPAEARPVDENAEGWPW